MEGRIELIIGPMFAGKTTELIRRVERAEYANLRCVMIKYSKDTRYSQDCVSTHDLKMHSAISCSTLIPQLALCQEYDLVGVDEGQFFPDIVEFSEILRGQGKTVIIAGLDGDFKRKPFGRLLELISRCDYLRKVSAHCAETGKSAPFTQRTTTSEEIELIGSGELYRPACRSLLTGADTTGEIHLTLGDTCSGKTTELIRILNRHYAAGQKTAIITEASSNLPAKYDILNVTKLPPIEDLLQYKVIGVDDAHKYENISSWADELANHGICVEIVALPGASDNTPFDSIIDLIPRCERVHKMDSARYPLTAIIPNFIRSQLMMATTPVLTINV